MNVIARCLLGCLAVASVAMAKTTLAGDTSEPAASDLTRWVKQLSSDDYSAREEATQGLIRAGRRSIPAVAAAAQEDDLEVTSRSMTVLRELLNSDDAVTEDAAAGALAKLAESHGTASAEMAAEVLSEVQGVRRDKALRQLEYLGADETTLDPETGDNTTMWIIIGAHWQGKIADLALLKRVVDVERITFRGVPLADDDVQNLEGLPHLRRLDLLGSKLTDKGLTRLARDYPNVRIDHGSNAMLGVGGASDATGNGFMVNTVQPGTAAERAGIVPGDSILKIQGRAIADFDTLTAEIHNHQPGDKVKIELRRGVDMLSKEVTLGSWK